MTSTAKYPGLTDPAWLRARYIDDGWSYPRIARHLGCSVTAVAARVTAADIPRRNAGSQSNGKGNRYPQLRDAAWLREQYVTLGKGSEAIAQTLGCTGTAVYRALKRHGIPPRPPSVKAPASNPYPQLRDPAWLRREHHDLGKPLARLAAEVGCDRETIRRALDDAGVEFRSENPTYPLLDDAGWLRTEYEEHGRSLAEIAAAVGCTDTGVLLAMERHGIPRRGLVVHEELRNRDWLRERYEVRRWPASYIARHRGCAESLVRDWLHRHDILPRQSPRGRQVVYPQLGDPAWLHRQYAVEGRSLRAIAAEVGCSNAETVARALRRHHIPTRNVTAAAANRYAKAAA
jgi:AraC-like DNA-binding protein